MPGIRITGLEIAAESADLARRSAALNGIEDDIEIITGDIKEAAGIFRHASFDAVTGMTTSVIQNAATQNVITFFFVGLEAITGIICALLLVGLNVERDIHKEQEEILLRKAAESCCQESGQ